MRKEIEVCRALGVPLTIQFVNGELLYRYEVISKKLEYLSMDEDWAVSTYQGLEDEHSSGHREMLWKLLEEAMK